MIFHIICQLIPSGEYLLRKIHNKSHIQEKRLPVYRFHRDFFIFFRGNVKSQGISGAISEASSNSGFFQEFQGSVANLLIDLGM